MLSRLSSLINSLTSFSINFSFDLVISRSYGETLPLTRKLCCTLASTGAIVNGAMDEADFSIGYLFSS